MCITVIFFPTLLLPLTPSAPRIAQAVSNHKVLEDGANQADQDVDAVDAVNGFMRAQVDVLASCRSRTGW